MLLVVEREFVHAREEILVVVVTTVLLSTFLHGLTANPLAKTLPHTLTESQRTMAPPPPDQKVTDLQDKVKAAQVEIAKFGSYV